MKQTIPAVLALSLLTLWSGRAQGQGQVWNTSDPETSEQFTLKDDGGHVNVTLGAVYGSLGSGTSGYLLTFEVEIKLTEKLTLSPAMRYYSVDLSSGRDEEEGTGFGPGFEVRYYPLARGNDPVGLSLGAGASTLVSQWEGEFDYNYNGVIEPLEKESDSGITFEMHLSLGYAFRTERFFIEPNLKVGYHSSSMGSSSGFWGLGLRAGMTF